MDYSNLPTRTPHDYLFYTVFSRKEKAKAFFEKYLPAPILSIADFYDKSNREKKNIFYSSSLILKQP
jgi:hypothetical protein